MELVSAKLTGAAGDDVEREAEQVSVASMWCHKLEVLCSAEVSSSIIFLWSKSLPPGISLMVR